MATGKIKVDGFEEIAKCLASLGEAGDEIARRAVYEGAGILADEIRRNLEWALNPELPSSGDLVASLGIATMETENGVTNTSIGFQGNDSKGVPNATKARVLESGRSDQKNRKGKGFIRHAVNTAKGKAEAAMVEEAERLIAEKLK